MSKSPPKIPPVPSAWRLRLRRPDPGTNVCCARTHTRAHARTHTRNPTRTPTPSPTLTMAIIWYHLIHLIPGISCHAIDIDSYNITSCDINISCEMIPLSFYHFTPTSCIKYHNLDITWWQILCTIQFDIICPFDNTLILWYHFTLVRHRDV